MASRKNEARIAGWLYFVSGIPAPFSLIYLPSKLVVEGDAAATAKNILAKEFLFRLGIAGELISVILFLFMGLAMYHLLKEVNRRYALMMLALIVVSVPISCLNELNRVAALMLVHGGASLAAFSPQQLDILAAAFLDWHGSGVVLAQIFWGLWLLPFGMLVYRSGFLPWILGVLLILAGIGYTVLSFTVLLAPAYGHDVFRVVGVLGALGEGGTILWLMIMGAKERTAVMVA
jgi:hypothetical protein